MDGWTDTLTSEGMRGGRTDSHIAPTDTSIDRRMDGWIDSNGIKRAGKVIKQSDKYVIRQVFYPERLTPPRSVLPLTWGSTEGTPDPC